MTARYLVGDVLEVLPTLDAGSVDLVMTSPPFLALRSYLPADHPDKAKEGGSQPTPGAFIDWLVDVVEALDRVLAPHGSMVIELGDTYAGSNETGWHRSGNEPIERYRSLGAIAPVIEKGTGWPADKSLTLIPELFRMTLVYGFNPLTSRQTKRWRLRNVIRWVRPNPPVGALGDKFRPATSELMVFCRTDEAGRKRYFDLDAVREPLTERALSEVANGGIRGGESYQGTAADWSGYDHGRTRLPATGGGAPPLDWWNIPLLDGEEPTRMESTPRQRKDGERSGTGPKTKNDDGSGAGWAWERTLINNPLGAPPLDWWEIPPGGYSGSHYAVFPEALCVRPIKAMCPEKVCRTCGEPSRRITDVSYTPHGIPEQQHAEPKARADYALQQRTENAQGMANGRATKNVNTLGFTDCGHDNYRNGSVLDPFAGSGTTLAVAVGHGRDAIGVDLDERNARLAEERIGFFLEVVGSIT